jgi:predicted regulator of Ras-like GTPase activity (Roadblock/LC7/MglB family)
MNSFAMTIAGGTSEILRNLNSSSAEVEASAVISIDGLAMASALSEGIDEDRVGAMTAAMLSLGNRTASELRRGKLDQVMVKGERGYVLLCHAGPEAVLVLVAQEGAKLGLVFLDAKRAAARIAEAI